MQIKELMRNPYVIERDMSLTEAAKLMSSKAIGSLIIVSGKKVKGIITEKDLIKNFHKEDKVSRVMTKEVITIEPDEDINRALELMKENKIKRLPVVENKELVGIITLTDIAANAEELEEDFFFS